MRLPSFEIKFLRMMPFIVWFELQELVPCIMIDKQICYGFSDKLILLCVYSAFVILAHAHTCLHICAHMPACVLEHIPTCGACALACVNVPT